MTRKENPMKITRELSHSSNNCWMLVALSVAWLGSAVPLSATTYNVIGTYADWPTNWVPVNALNDPDDGLANVQLDFVGDAANPGAYYASNTEYVFFRQRVDLDTASAMSVFHDAHLVLIDLAGQDYNTTTKALQSGSDGYPDYGFAWDSKSNDNTKHGLEMVVRSTAATYWNGINMDDIDYSVGQKLANDINGGGRTTDGYLRVIDQQSTTVFGGTTYIDYAVKWSYLQAYTGLTSNQVWRVAFGSISDATDHNNLNADISGGASPASLSTNGWAQIRSGINGVLGDRVWEDTNGNGIQDAGEPGITNVTVQFYDAASNLLATTSTGADGRYTFASLEAANYFVRFTPPSGYTFTAFGAGGDATLDSNAGADGWTAAVSLAYGQTAFGIDAGLYVPAALHGYVFFDQVSDLVRVPGEDPSVSGRLVWLLRDGVAVATNRTDVAGYYSFSTLRPGPYTVLFDADPSELIAVPAEGGAAVDPERNRALTTGTSDAYIVHAVQSGDGVIAGRFDEPLNAGFDESTPLKAAIDIRAVAMAGGVAVEFRTIEEAGTNDIVLSVRLDGAWVKVGRAEAHGEGSHLYQFTVAGLDWTQLHDFTIEDDEGYTSTIANLVTDPFAATLVRMERDGIQYAFDSIPDRTYDIYCAASPAGPWGAPVKTVTAEDYLTVVLLPKAPGATTAFFKTVLRGE